MLLESASFLGGMNSSGGSGGSSLGGLGSMWTSSKTTASRSDATGYFYSGEFNVTTGGGGIQNAVQSIGNIGWIILALGLVYFFLIKGK